MENLIHKMTIDELVAYKNQLAVLKAKVKGRIAKLKEEKEIAHLNSKLKKKDIVVP